MNLKLLNYRNLCGGILLRSIFTAIGCRGALPYGEKTPELEELQTSYDLPTEELWDTFVPCTEQLDFINVADNQKLTLPNCASILGVKNNCFRSTGQFHSGGSMLQLIFFIFTFYFTVFSTNSPVCGVA